MSEPVNKDVLDEQLRAGPFHLDDGDAHSWASYLMEGIRPVSSMRQFEAYFQEHGDHLARPLPVTSVRYEAECSCGAHLKIHPLTMRPA
jgi:hypothetical protein